MAINKSYGYELCQKCILRLWCPYNNTFHVIHGPRLSSKTVDYCDITHKIRMLNNSCILITDYSSIMPSTVFKFGVMLQCTP